MIDPKTGDTYQLLSSMSFNLQNGKESPITFDRYVEYLEKRHDVKYEVYLLSQ
jgi:hypothetical protein